MSLKVTADGLERYCPACERSFHAGDVCPDDGTTLILLSSGPDPLIGTTLDGRYTILEKLGAGGMGTVYRGVQLSVDREVAIKVVSPNLLAHSEVIKRFLREAKLASRLNHQNAVAVLDFGRASGDLFFLVMEKLAGRTLEDLIATERRLPVDRALAIAHQICDALVGAHELQIVHRDLKPSNIMLVTGAGGRELIKVLDFGLAKLVSSEVSAQVTRTGIMLGTPAYMSPELAIGRDADARADLYALGCILYEMLTGRVPFAGATLHETLSLHASEPPRPLTDVPPWLAAVVLRLLSKNPDQRFPSAAETRKALSTPTADPVPVDPGDRPSTSVTDVTRPEETGPTLLGPTPVAVGAHSAPLVLPPRRRGRTLVVALAIAALAAVAVISWQLQGSGSEPSEAPAAATPPARTTTPAVQPPRPAAVIPAEAAADPAPTGSLSAADAAPTVQSAAAEDAADSSPSKRDRRRSGRKRGRTSDKQKGEEESGKGGLPF